MKIVYFLILNYKTKDETVKCIESIKKLESEKLKKKVVVIDNNSEDGSYEELLQIYKEEIEVYKTKENLGFSAGNNLGYKIIREKNDADFVIICNSDVEFRQKNFLNLIESEYKKSGFYILGPDVWCENDLKKGWKGHQSPAYPWEYKRSFLYWQYTFFKTQLEFLTLGGGQRKIKYFLIRLINFVIGRCLKICMRTIYRKHRLCRHENVPVQGSCIVLSEKFLVKEDKLFTPETKFYGEEILLYLKQKKYDIHTIYNPVLQVYHMQGRATEKLGEDIKRKIFISKNIAESNSIILENMQKYKNGEFRE